MGYTLRYNTQIYERNPNSFRIDFYIIISGESDLTPQQLKQGLDVTLTNLKNEINTHFTAQGATNIKYHIHYSTGSVDTSG